VTLHSGDDPLKGVEGDLFDVRLEIEPGNAAAFGFVMRGEMVMWTARDRQISALGRTALLEPVDGVIKLQVLLDRTSLEVFGNDGLVNMPTCFLPDLTNKGLGFFAIGGDVKVRKLEAYEMRSAWEKP
jgi:sucrose-6-phosphate hydrolase SacC (GH32 family)